MDTRGAFFDPKSPADSTLSFQARKTLVQSRVTPVTPFPWSTRRVKGHLTVPREENHRDRRGASLIRSAKREKTERELR